MDYYNRSATKEYTGRADKHGQDEPVALEYDPLEDNAREYDTPDDDGYVEDAYPEDGYADDDYPENGAGTRRRGSSRDIGVLRPVLSRPAYTLAESDLEYIYPKSKRKAVLRAAALFAVLFAAVYLLTNRLSDRSAVNEGAIGPEGAVGLTEQIPTQSPAPTDPAGGSEFDMSQPFVPDFAALFDRYPSARTIAENIWSYPIKLLELALKNNETMDYVAGYLTHGGSSADAASIDISQELEAGGIPHFLQWDERWGYSYYNTELMGLAGCGPTALSMVAAGLTGNTSLNPRYVADFSQLYGFVTSDNSTTWTLMSVGSLSLGVTPRELPLDENLIKEAVLRGEPVIASMSQGDFTTTGHFIVIIGVSENGGLLVLDPNSNTNTQKEWDYESIKSQIRNLWAFTETE